MTRIGCLAVIILALLLGGIYSYVRSMQMINWYVSRCGAYPTLDEAIAGDMRHNGLDPSWFEEYIKSPNRKDNPHIWYVVPRELPAYHDAVNRIRYRIQPGLVVCGGSFYVQTKYGWVGMPENDITGFGLLDWWMGTLNLYGEDG
jgi:hypothetical protein